MISVLFLSACGGGGGSSSLPAPTGSPAPVAQNYFPVANQAGWEGGLPSGGYQWLSVSSLTTSESTTCGKSIGSFGDYEINPYVQMADYAIASDPSFKYPGQYPTYVITKDSTGNVYVVGYQAGGGNPIICVAPYVLVKSQMANNETWTYTDINGRSKVATVVEAGPQQSFTVTGNGPHGGQSFVYSNVAEVNYGNEFTVYYAAGYGPVQTINQPQYNSGEPLVWTAYGYVKTAGSP